MSSRIETAAARNTSISQAEERTALNFEMAYQIRVAIDQIRFAIRSGESSPDEHSVILETRMQLLDARQRLLSAERHFMSISRNGV